MGNMSSKNTINDESYQGLKATSGAAHVNVQNTAIPTYDVGTGGEGSFAATNPDTIALGDLTAFGLPFGSLTFSKSNTGTADLTYGIVNGSLMFQISNTAGTIAVTISGTTVFGDVFDGPLAYVTSGGTIQATAIAADGVFYLYMGR